MVLRTDVVYRFLDDGIKDGGSAYSGAVAMVVPGAALGICTSGLAAFPYIAASKTSSTDVVPASRAASSFAASASNAAIDRSRAARRCALLVRFVELGACAAVARCLACLRGV